MSASAFSKLFLNVLKQHCRHVWEISWSDCCERPQVEYASYSVVIK